MKLIDAQVRAMRRCWPQFDVYVPEPDRALWFGPLCGIERTYRLMIEYGLPGSGVEVETKNQDLFRQFPAVRVLSPLLEPRFDALEEAPLPHVYFDNVDLTLSPLCLFDPAAAE